MNKTSLSKLETCHEKIIFLAVEVNKEFPIQCICGERNQEDQNKAFESGVSRVKWPNSKHNVNKEAGREKSHAGDFVPDPDRNPKTLDWGDIEAFEEMCKVFERVAKKHNIKIRLGRDFSFKDMPHVELKG